MTEHDPTPSADPGPRRCPKGHTVPSGQHLCPACGKPVDPTALADRKRRRSDLLTVGAVVVAQVLVVVLLLALGGCSTGAATSKSSATPSQTLTAPVTVATSATPIPTPTSTPTSTAPSTGPAEFTFECYDEEYDDHTFSSLQSVWRESDEWSEPLECSVEVYEYGSVMRPSERQRAALVAYGKATTDVAALRKLYDVCANAFYVEDAFPSERKKLRAAAVLCPDKTEARDMRDYAAGRLISDGTYEVGKEIKAGTWRTTERVSDCYWERVDGAGNTIDNNFITGAPRAEVTVRSSDAGFTSEDCGTWRRA